MKKHKKKRIYNCIFCKKTSHEIAERGFCICFKRIRYRVFKPNGINKIITIYPKISSKKKLSKLYWDSVQENKKKKAVIINAETTDNGNLAITKKIVKIPKCILRKKKKDVISNLNSTDKDDLTIAF